MWKRTILTALAAVAAWGQPTVLISDTLRMPNGSVFTGTATITLRYAGPLDAAGTTLTAGTIRVNVYNGTLTLPLTPNTMIQPPGTSYNVRFAPNTGQPWEETWVVPSTPGNLRVAQVRVSTVPQPTVLFNPNQISTAGATTGQVLTFNGTSVVWAAGGGGGGGAGVWGSITGIITNQTDLMAYLNSKANLTHTHTWSDVVGGLIPYDRLGTGTPTATNFLRGDRTWASVQWTDVTGRPATFPPSPHAHPISEVTNLQSALDSKANAAHTHVIADVSNLQPALDGKASLSHTHPIADVINLQPALDSKAAVTHTHAASDTISGTFAAARLGSGSATSSTFLRGDQTWTAVQWADVGGRPSTFPPSTHTHTLGDLAQSGASAGQVAKWNGTAWVPAADDVGSGSSPNVSQPFTNQTLVTITHNRATTNVLVACYNTNGDWIIPQQTTVTSANAVTVTFGQATSGVCIVNTASGGGGGGGGTGTVTSVGLTMPAGFSVAGSPVTTSGTLAVTTSLSGVVRAAGGGFTVVTGNPTDCVRVDGTSGACGSGGGTVHTGSGLTGDGSQANPVRIDSASGLATQAYYAAGLDFPAIGAASCAEMNITAAGVSSGQTVAPGWPATGLASGLVGMMYAGTNAVVVRLCNVTASSIDPPSATYTVRTIGTY